MHSRFTVGSACSVRDRLPNMTDTSHPAPDPEPEPESPVVDPGAQAPSADAQPPKKKSRLKGIAIGVGVTLAAVAVIAIGVMFINRPTPFEAAVEACDLTGNPGARLGDDGNSLALDMEGDAGGNGLAIEDSVCVLNELDVPDSVLERMSSTRALDGQQDGDWDGVTAIWTYHPDNGLDIILERN